MSQNIIDTGQAANDGTGEPLRQAFTAINNNFSQIWSSGPVNSNVQIANNRILTTTTNQALILAPNGIGNVQANAAVIPGMDSVYDLGASDRRWDTVWAQYVEISGPATFNDVTVDGNLTVQGDIIEIGNIVTDSKTIQLANTAASTAAANGSGITVGANDNIATMLYSSTSNTWTMNIGASITGNVTAPYFIGNGSLLTGLASPYGNANVAAFLANFGSNIINTTGNISAPDGNTSVLFNDNGNIGAAFGFTYNKDTDTLRTDNLFSTSGSFIGNEDSGAQGLYVGQGSYTPLGSTVMLQVTGNVENYAQINLQNISDGVLASADYVITADNGSDSTYYLDLGLAGSNHADSDFFGDTSTANDGYLYVTASDQAGPSTGGPGNLILGSTNGVVKMFVGNTAQANVIATVASDGLSLAGNIVPITSNVYSLGNSTNQWSDLYVSNATIYMNNVPISLTAGNVLTVNGEALLSNDSNTSISTTGNITADYFFGDGSQLTGLNTNKILNGTSNVEIATANGNVTVTANGSSTWTFDTTGNLATPANLVIGNAPAGGSSILQYDAPLQVVGEGANAIMVVGWSANTNAPDSIAAVAFNAPYTNGASNVQIAVGNNATTVNYWTFANDGTTTFPTLTVDLHNGGNQAGQVLQFGDGTQQAIITGPTPSVDNNAQRLIIQGQAGNGTGEGGDVYLWGGDAEFNGGDIKIYAGDADNVTSGSGGYVNIEGGSGFDFGGHVSMQGGQTNNGQGAYAQVVGGYGVSGGDANIVGGQGYAGAGGAVNITGGVSGNGIAEYGNVNVTAGASTWTFDNTGNLTIVHGSQIQEVASPVPGNYALALRGTGSVSADQQLLIYPTSYDANHLHLTSGNLYNTELFLGNDNLYVKLANTGDVVINTDDLVGNTAQWTFGTDGVLSAAGNISASNFVGSGSNVELVAGSSTWTFDNTGNLTAPGNVVANTFVSTEYNVLTAGNLSITSQYGLGVTGTILEQGGTLELIGNGTGLGTTGCVVVGWNSSYGGGLGPVSQMYFNPPGSSGNAVLTTGNLAATSYDWTFDDTGNLTLPTTSANINYSNGVSILDGIGGTYGNANVADFLDSLGSNAIVTTGNITGGNILTSGIVSTTGNITAGNFVAPASTANRYVLYNDTGVIGGSAVFTFDENGNTLSIGTTAGTLKVADISTPQAGVNLRLVPSTGLTYSYGNFVPLFANTYDLGSSTNRWNNLWANVANTVTANTVTLSASGNITGGNINATANIIGSGYALLSGTFDESQASTAGLYLGYAGGTPRIMFGTGTTGQTLEIDNDGGTLRFYKPGTTLASLTNSGVFSAAGNITGSNVLTAGMVSATGNVYGANAILTGTATTGVYALDVGASAAFLSNTVASFTANVNNYTQLTLQNLNTGADATADFILTANNGSDTVNYGDFGIINSGYDNNTPTNSLGNIVYAADTYLYAQGNVSNTSQSGGNLVIGTAVANKTVKIFAGGNTASALVANISNVGISVAGNVTANNFIGNISIVGNVTGTSANVTLVAGSYSTVFDNGGNLTAPSTGYVMGGTLKSTNSSGNEGGELQLALAPTATISGTSVSIDSYQDRLRIFEGGGNSRGVFIDLAKAPDGVSGELMWKASGVVNAGVDVTLGNLKARIPTSGNRSLQVSTVSGTYSVSGSGVYYAGGAGGATINGSSPLTITTTPTYLAAGLNFSAAGYTDTWIIYDASNSIGWRITLVIGVSYANNMISIERLA